MPALADVKEAAELSESKANAYLEEALSKLLRRVELTDELWMDIEAGAIALFQLTVLETRKIDDVATIAATWQSVTETYARLRAKLTKASQELSTHIDLVPPTDPGEVGTLRRAPVPPQLTRLIRRLGALQERSQELYELHA